MSPEPEASSVVDVFGQALVAHLWRHPSSDRVVVIQHGLGEHGGRYTTVVPWLLEAGCHVVAFDAAGHGRSGGARGDVGTLAQQAARLRSVIPSLRDAVGGRRTVLWGHSMGAAVALTLVLEGAPPDLAGVILTATPVVVHRTPMMRVKILAGRVLVRVAPKIALASGLDANGISSVSAEVERYRADPLVHDRITVEAGASLIDDAEALPLRMSALHLPALLVHGAEDPICPPEGTRRLQAAAGPSVRTALLPGRHELHHEAPSTRAAFADELRGFVTRVMP